MPRHYPILYLMAFAILVAVTQVGPAATRTWDNDSMDNLYVTDANWSNDMEPGPADAAHLAADGDLAMVLTGDSVLTRNIRIGRDNGTAGAPAVLNQTGGSITANRVWVGGHNAIGNGEINISGGTFTTDSTSTSGTGTATFRIGVNAGSVGKVTVTDATLTVGERLTVGNEGTGTLILSSGAINVGSGLNVGRFGGTGTATLLDGTVTIANTLAVEDCPADCSMLGGSVIDLYDATIIIEESGDDGDYTAEIDALVAAGALQAFGGVGVIMRDFNVTNSGVTTVTAVIPEPASITLCSLGLLMGLAVRRRAN